MTLPEGAAASDEGFVRHPMLDRFSASAVGPVVNLLHSMKVAPRDLGNRNDWGGVACGRYVAG
jgi:hypothetical protein